ncbi:HD family phosphohydrolase [Spirochaetia bacterium]|nr:HD family phosphohydrolase [Spirochaetia bacterium]
MTIRMDSLVKTIATALDIVEGELLGASTHHGKRIAVLCAAMGKALGMGGEELLGLTICALLHDNALTEYILSEREGERRDAAMKLHCEYGQRNVNALHFKADVRNFVLYHHEWADGSGPFGIQAGDGPLGAELIAIADSLDVAHHLQRQEPEGLSRIRAIIAEKTGTQYSKQASAVMLEILDWPMLLSLKDEVILKTATQAIPPWLVDTEEQTSFGLASFITRIIDYKSVFTRRHSTQIANKAWYMGGRYGYTETERAELYLAAALHDIGKLATPVAILEKPGKLTNEEFLIIKEHVRITWEILKDIEGFETICAWASNHHEKLDGTGYPFGKKAEELDFNSRLLACIDIYQAVSEERPYHPGRNHGDTIKILYDMAEKGQVDSGIVKDIDAALTPFNGGDLPAPAQTACF